MALRPIGMRSGLNSSVSERIEREKQDGLAHASEKIWVEDFETGAWGLSTRGSIANYRNRRVNPVFCAYEAYTGDAAEADAYLRDPGSEASQAWLEAQLAPGGGQVRHLLARPPTGMTVTSPTRTRQ